jgi:hypothetical protein
MTFFDLALVMKGCCARMATQCTVVAALDKHTVFRSASAVGRLAGSFCRQTTTANKWASQQRKTARTRITSQEVVEVFAPLAVLGQSWWVAARDDEDGLLDQRTHVGSAEPQYRSCRRTHPHWMHIRVRRLALRQLNRSDGERPDVGLHQRETDEAAQINKTFAPCRRIRATARPRAPSSKECWQNKHEV